MDHGSRLWITRGYMCACYAEREIGHRESRPKTIINNTWCRETRWIQAARWIAYSPEENAARLSLLMRWELINRTGAEER